MIQETKCKHLLEIIIFLALFVPFFLIATPQIFAADEQLIKEKFIDYPNKAVPKTNGVAVEGAEYTFTVRGAPTGSKYKWVLSATGGQWTGSGKSRTFLPLGTSQQTHYHLKVTVYPPGEGGEGDPWITEGSETLGNPIVKFSKPTKDQYVLKGSSDPVDVVVKVTHGTKTLSGVKVEFMEKGVAIGSFNPISPTTSIGIAASEFTIKATAKAGDSTTLQAKCGATVADGKKVTVFEVELTRDPLNIAAETAWAGIDNDLQRSALTVSVNPPEAKADVIDDIALEVKEVTGGAGYNPGDGTLTQDATDKTKWTYAPFTEPKTEKHPKTKDVKIIAKYDEQECSEEVLVRVKYVFLFLTTDESDYNKAWQYAKWKYGIATSGLDTIEYNSSLGSRALTIKWITGVDNCKLGPGAMINENRCASTLGHENIHGNQSYWYVKTHIIRGPSHFEVPAYQWEIDNKSTTGISQTFLDMVTWYRDYYNGTRDDPPPG